MPVVQLVVNLPQDVSPVNVWQLLEQNQIQVCSCAVNGSSPLDLPPLTPTELRVLRAFTQYDTNQEMADFLGVHVSTVRTHVNNLFRKLQVKSRHLAFFNEGASPGAVDLVGCVFPS